jgi:hypothetical protein
MSTHATTTVEAVFRTAVIEGDARPGTTSRNFGRWFLNRLQRFFDRLPDQHPDVDLEVLKRVSTPI